MTSPRNDTAYSSVDDDKGKLYPIDDPGDSKENEYSVPQGPQHDRTDSNDEKHHHHETNVLFNNHYAASNLKVLCRQEEETIMDASYQRAKSGEKKQLVMIQGRMGVGKSTMAHVLRRRVLEDNGYFLDVKFDQGVALRSSASSYHHNNQMAFLSSAFDGLCDQLLQRGESVLAKIKQQINDSIGNEMSVLMDIAPDLYHILADEDSQNTQSSGSLGGGREAGHRLEFIFHLLLEAVSSPKHPLVLFLDDLHFADETSLDLFWSLVNTTSAGTGILFAATVRTDVNIQKIEKELIHLNGHFVQSTTITLESFSAEEVNIILSHILDSDPERTKTLARVVAEQTKGNAFFIVEFLYLLKEEGLLQYNKEARGWSWDVEEISVEYSDVRDLVLERLYRVSNNSVLEVLKVAACLGSKLDEECLSFVLETPVFTLLREATDRGLLRYNSITRGFEFSHDGIQDVVYNLINSVDKERFHYNLGRKLWEAYPIDELLNSNAKLGFVLGQLLLGTSMINDPRERSAVAEICLHAGQRAAKQSSFMTAYEYLIQGLHVLGERKWQDYYQLTLNLHNSAAEVAYCTGNFTSVFEMVEETLREALNFHDTLSAQSTKVYALGGTGRMEAAVDLGLSVLGQLGVVFPASPGLRDVESGLKRTRKLLGGRSDEFILRLEPLTDPVASASMQVLNLIFFYALMTRAELAPLIGWKIIEITMFRGLSGVSCIGFVIHGMILCGLGGDIDEGFRYGQLALRLSEKFGGKAWFGRVAANYYSSVHGWKHPIPESTEPLQRAFRLGLEAGDIEFAMLNANIYCWGQLNYSSLPTLDSDIASVASRMRFYGQSSTMLLIAPFWQFVNNLMGKARGDPKRLIGDIFDEESQATSKQTQSNLHWSSFQRMIIAYLLGDYDKAQTEADACSALTYLPFGSVDAVSVIFFDGLTALAQAGRTKKNRKHIARAEKQIKRISSYAQYAPTNFLGKQYLLEAELAAVKGSHSSVFAQYTAAVALFRHADMLMPTALANERAGKYFLARGDKDRAVLFLKEAMKLWEDWGSPIKIESLEDEVGDVLFN